MILFRLRYYGPDRQASILVDKDVVPKGTASCLFSVMERRDDWTMVAIQFKASGGGYKLEGRKTRYLITLPSDLRQHVYAPEGVTPLVAAREHSSRWVVLLPGARPDPQKTPADGHLVPGVP